MNCIASIKKYHNMFHDNPIPPKTTNPSIIIVAIKKFTPSLATVILAEFLVENTLFL